MQKSLFRLGLILIALFVPSALLADTIYSVNQTIGAGGVTGTITTDGTIGVLGGANITGWDLTLNDGSHTTNLLTSNSNFSSGIHDLPGVNVDLTATATNLFFNYSAPDGGSFSFENTNGQVCYTSWSNCFGPTAVGLFNVGNDGAFDFVGESGNQVIATAVATPEPGSLALLGSGLLGLGGALRKRFVK